eukprot:SAG11_NODE_2347_length_3487_cov_1.303129_3_plen_63_part_00
MRPPNDVAARPHLTSKHTDCKETLFLIGRLTEFLWRCWGGGGVVVVAGDVRLIARCAVQRAK